MSDSTGTQKYWYISHTRPDLTNPVGRLIEAARSWRPCAGRVIDEYDFAALAQRALPAERLDGVRPSGDVRATAEAVLDVMNHEEHRRGPAEHLEAERARLVPRLAERIAEGLPIRVVIPSFPGRPYNPITHQRVAPDLGEAYAFVLLARISNHVAAVYPPGVEFVLCLDGRAYNPFYGYTDEADHQYPVDLRRFIDALGVSRAVSLIDLQDLVDERAAEFEPLCGQVRGELAEEWRRPDYAFRDELVETMKLGTNTMPLNAAAIYLFKYPDPASDPAELVAQMHEATRERARLTAFEYMVFLVTIRRMELIERKLPDAIRGTVHPKPGQYSPYLVSRATKVAPWHGVAVVRPDGSIDTVYEAEVFEDTSRYTAVYLRGDYMPFFYEERG
jgi:L-tyrosine isonitrile synthase